LIGAGKDRHTPAAVIARGTHPDAETVQGELHEIAVLAAGLPSPALLVIGEVVALSATLAGAGGLLSLSAG
jgi:siroheme synthase